MYIVTFCQNEKSCEPSVFPDKLAAYKRWAEVLMKGAYIHNIVDELYRPFIDSIKDFTDYCELKEFIDDTFRINKNAYPVENGYALCCSDGSKIVIQIFEVEEE